MTADHLHNDMLKYLSGAIATLQMAAPACIPACILMDWAAPFSQMLLPSTRTRSQSLLPDTSEFHWYAGWKGLSLLNKLYNKCGTKAGPKLVCQLGHLSRRYVTVALFNNWNVGIHVLRERTTSCMNLPTFLVSPILI